MEPAEIQLLIDIKSELAANTVETRELRHYLLGNGQPGRIQMIEADLKDHEEAIAALHDNHIEETTFKKLVRYGIDVGIAILASFGYHHIRH